METFNELVFFDFATFRTDERMVLVTLRDFFNEIIYLSYFQQIKNPRNIPLTMIFDLFIKELDEKIKVFEKITEGEGAPMLKVRHFLIGKYKSYVVVCRVFCESDSFHPKFILEVTNILWEIFQYEMEIDMFINEFFHVNSHLYKFMRCRPKYFTSFLDFYTPTTPV